MKKRLLYFIALTSSAILIAANLLAQTPVYVDASRPDNSGDGLSWATAKQTIGAGITLVAPGGTVNVAPGTYNEKLYINKSLTLKGAGKTQTHLVGTGDTGHKTTLRIENANGVTIDGIHVTNPTQTHPSGGGAGVGISIFGGSQNVVVQDCLVDSIGDPNRTSTNPSFGILVDGGAQNIEVANNEVRDIKAAFTTGNLVGILVRGNSSNVSVHDNVVSDIVGTGGSIVHGVGIQAAALNNVTVNHNAIDRAHLGIFTAGPSSHDITDNMVTNADSCGILLRANSQTVTSNAVSGSSRGIGLWPGTPPPPASPPPLNATITDNKITGNTTGVAVISTTNLNATMHSNCISGNTTGMENMGPGQVTAENNWWGHATGPYNAASNSSGIGNAVSNDVDFSPWLTELVYTNTDFTFPSTNVDIELKLSNSAPGGADGAKVFLYLGGTPAGHEVTDPDGLVSLGGEVPAGVYPLKAEAAGGCLSAFAVVVVYDPGAGFVTGQGWISSPPGAYVPSASVTGKAKFEFTLKYKKGAGVPTGETGFQFQLANLNFTGTSYDWLVVGGPGIFRAQFKGSGKINGTGNYGFTLSVIDGDLKSPREKDRFRLMIWDASSSEVVYDNQSGDPWYGDPTMAIGGGSIVIHVPKKREVADDLALEMAAGFVPTEFALFESYPNPFNPATNIRFDIPSPSVVTLKVYDVLGREVTALVDNEHREAGRYEVTFDASRLASGVYFYRVTAGSFTSIKKMLLLK